VKPDVDLEGDGYRLRAWRDDDLQSLVRNADNRNVWINLTDGFPHPYTAEDGRSWLSMQASEDHGEIVFAIELNGAAVGGIGLERGGDLQTKVAEIGYWLGQDFWGRGLMTRVLRQVTDWAFETTDLERIWANVLAWNPGSGRVLEKAGYQLEARLRRNVFKDGQVIDSLLYAKLRD
jgi:RimJ/RimL family protein N-acetyltransferase